MCYLGICLKRLESDKKVMLCQWTFLSFRKFGNNGFCKFGDFGWFKKMQA